VLNPTLRGSVARAQCLHELRTAYAAGLSWLAQRGDKSATFQLVGLGRPLNVQKSRNSGNLGG
jgi:hypothetical protein